MKLSVVITVLNEADTIDLLLAGLLQQTTPVDEIVIVDGGSADQTKKIIKEWQKNPSIGKKIKFFTKEGNRSVGRNHAIKQAKHDWLAITDAGCLPIETWLEELIAAQKKSQAPVIAGYYFGLPENNFQQAVIPYVLVPPNKVDPENFLPATRSMMISRDVWKKLGGFDEKLDHNEDYALAKKMVKPNIEIKFTDRALVGWLPTKNLKDFYRMIYRFALGDIEASIVRPKVKLVFLRYVLVFTALIWTIITNQFLEIYSFFVGLILIYSYWAILKNQRYVEYGRLWLPVLQFTADIAVMLGSLKGFFKKKNN